MDLKQVYDITGLTKRELAAKLGVGENYLWMIESGKRKMSKAITLQLQQLMSNVTNNCQYPVEKPPTQPANIEEQATCALCGQKHCNAIRPDEVDIYQPKNIANTVLDNNHKLTEICDGISAISNGIGALTKLDKLIQHRVDNVMSTRSRALIAVYNHHIEAQAKVMINDLESLIKLLKAGAISLDGAIMMLEDHKQHLADLRGYDPSNPTHNPTGGSPWNAPQGN